MEELERMGTESSCNRLDDGESLSVDDRARFIQKAPAEAEAFCIVRIERVTSP